MRCHLVEPIAQLLLLEVVVRAVLVEVDVLLVLLLAQRLGAHGVDQLGARARAALRRLEQRLLVLGRDQVVHVCLLEDLGDRRRTALANLLDVGAKEGKDRVRLQLREQLLLRLLRPPAQLDLTLALQRTSPPRLSMARTSVSMIDRTPPSG